jgi:hypothetical protein
MTAGRRPSKISGPPASTRATRVRLRLTLPPDQLPNLRNDGNQCSVQLSEPAITTLAPKGINAQKAQTKLHQILTVRKADIVTMAVGASPNSHVTCAAPVVLAIFSRRRRKTEIKVVQALKPFISNDQAPLRLILTSRNHCYTAHYCLF